MKKLLPRFAAIALVVSVGFTASPTPVSARPADDVSPLSTSCAVRGDLAQTFYAVSCISDWPWENFIYVAWVRCTDERTYYGKARSSFWDPGTSAVACPMGHHYVNSGH